MASWWKSTADSTRISQLSLRFSSSAYMRLQQAMTLSAGKCHFPVRWVRNPWARAGKAYVENVQGGKSSNEDLCAGRHCQAGWVAREAVCSNGSAYSTNAGKPEFADFPFVTILGFPKNLQNCQHKGVSSGLFCRCRKA